MTPTDRAKAANSAISKIYYDEHPDRESLAFDIITEVIADSEAALAQAVRELADCREKIDLLAADRESLTRQLAEAKDWAQKCEASQVAWQENHAKELWANDALRAENATATDALEGIAATNDPALSQARIMAKAALSAPASQDGETKSVNFMQTVCTCCKQPKDHRELIGTCQACRDSLASAKARIAEVEVGRDEAIRENKSAREVVIPQWEHNYKSAISDRDLITTQHDATLARIVESEEKHKATAKDLETAFRVVRLENDSLTAKLAMAEDAATKGESGRTLGTAYEGAMARVKELEEDGKLLDELERKGVWSCSNDRREWKISSPGKDSTLRAAIRTAMTETGGGE